MTCELAVDNPAPMGSPDDPVQRSSRPLAHRAHQLWGRWQWLRAFGWPRRFPIVQFPNLPLALAFVAGQAAGHLRGPAHDYAMAISYLAMAVWAYLELFAGVNWFRRLLGAFYTASTAVHLAHTLGH